MKTIETNAEVCFDLKSLKQKEFFASVSNNILKVYDINYFQCILFICPNQIQQKEFKYLECFDDNCFASYSNNEIQIFDFNSGFNS